MKKIKENLLPLLNIVSSLIMFIILLFSELNENVMYIMIMTLIVGWAIPYCVLLITGLSMLYSKKHYLTLIFNIVNILLCIFLLFFIIKLYDKTLLVLLIEYIITIIFSTINIIYYIIYIKKHPDIESQKIKKLKKENNGAIV